MAGKALKRSAEAEQPQRRSAARTKLGRKLLALRKKIIESGDPLLDWDEVDEEVATRRGQR
jgi:hypothetical protein